MLMPDGKDFEFWDDRTQYRRVLHVAGQHPAASDDNAGTEQRPLQTIGRAAQLAEPGVKVVIRGGVYRECVVPARGGDGPEAMIAYQAAPGEKVAVRGSELWTAQAAEFRPTDGHLARKAEAAGVKVWMGDLPSALFGGFNPFLLNNTSGVMMSYGHVWTPEEMRRYLLKRGMLFADGRPLRQAHGEGELLTSDGCFWVNVAGPSLHFRLPGDRDPGEAELEITAREQAFAPRRRGLGYIRVTGITFEHTATPITTLALQRGAVSAAAGHHWIVEDCTIRHSNACGLDVGIQENRLPAPERLGGNIIRRNTISHCGITGLCGLDSPDETLVEDNVFEHIGGLQLERMFECAALKFHVCHRVLIRRNIFRHLTQACGIWLDFLCGRNRVTGNVFADIDSTFGGVHVESSFEPHWIDGNVFWDMRSWRAAGQDAESPVRGGHGIFADSCDQVTIAHNFFGPTVSYAAACHFKQPERIAGGRVGLNRRHRIVNNVFCRCAKRVLLGRAEENVCDGNIYDREGDRGSLCIYRPEPRAVLNLAAWQEYYFLDKHSIQASVSASFDPESGVLTWQIDKEALVAEAPVRWPAQRDAPGAPGPFSPQAWQSALKTGSGKEKFPLRPEEQGG